MKESDCFREIIIKASGVWYQPQEKIMLVFIVLVEEHTSIPSLLP